jgi:radical SAM superfamily enzyme YgiQ (UPF0313 family)
VRQSGKHDAAIVDGENIRREDIGPSHRMDENPEIIMNEGIPRMVEILENPDHQFWGDMERLVSAQSPDLVGITCNSVNMDAARLITQRLKRHNLRVILGGSHPTVLPQQSITYTGADMAAVSEGEHTLMSLLDALQAGTSLSSIPGLAWKTDGHINVNPRGPLINNLDELPIPDRSFIDRGHYYGEVIMTGRGCPFKCAYCASRTIWGTRVRLRSVHSIIEELTLLKHHADSPTPRPGRWVVKVLDDTFTVHRKRTLAMLNEIIAKGLNCFEFTGGVRADTLDETLVRRMRQANFQRVTLGVESGSPKILEIIHKGETNDDVKRAVTLLKEAGIRSHAFFMVGLPEETPEDIELSKKLIVEARPDYVEINMVTPYPGTEIFDKLMPEEPSKIDRWYRWFHQGLATHSDRLGYDLDEVYQDFLAFATDYNASGAV